MCHGNHSHSGMSGIKLPTLTLVFFLFFELVEVKYAPEERPPNYFLEIGITLYLMLLPTKILHRTGNISMLDDGLCVFQVLVDMNSKGVYGSNIIRKGRYWTHYIDGDKIKSQSTNKLIGAVE